MNDTDKHVHVSFGAAGYDDRVVEQTYDPSGYFGAPLNYDNGVRESPNPPTGNYDRELPAWCGASATGTLTGRVFYGDNSSASGATVTLQAGGAGSVTTGGNGMYTFANLVPGIVHVSAIKGNDSGDRDARIDAGKTTKADILLGLGCSPIATPGPQSGSKTVPLPVGISSPSKNCGGPPPPPPPPPPINVTVVSAYPHNDVFTRGQSFHPSVVVQTSGVSLDCNQDFLKNVDGNLYSGYPNQGCTSLGGNQYKFYFNTPMVAPSSPGTYHSQWQIFHYPGLIGSPIDLPFTVPQPQTDGVQLWDGQNYTGSSAFFTYTSDSACIDLGSLDKQVSSLRFLGTYSAGSGSVYHAVMYNDSGCNTYLARYIGQDQSQLGGLDNTFAGMRIERHTAPAYVKVCTDPNGGGDCRTYPYSDGNQCIPFPELHDNVSSLGFSGTYDGSQYQAVMYHDTGCQVYLARYDNDQGVPPLGLLDNQFNSMRIEQHPCFPSGYEAAFFTQPNWMGQCIVHAVGDRTNADAFHLPNDSIQSVRVGVYVQALLYRDENYQGISETFTRDDYDLSDNTIGANIVSSLRVVSAPPLPPGSPSPPDGGGFNQGQDVTLFWGTAINATAYNGEWWGSDNVRHPFDWQSGRVSDIGVLPIGTYLWHVRAQDAQGTSGWSPIWVFTIRTPQVKGAPSYGTGKDGDLTVANGQTTYTDTVRTTVGGMVAQGQQTLPVTDATGFAVGDEALVAQMYGGASTVGQYEFATVTGVSGNQLTFAHPLTNAYNLGTVPATACPNGFTGQYFSNVAFSGAPAYSQCDSAINFVWPNGGPANLPSKGYSIRWTGTFSFPAGIYRFDLASYGATLFIDGQQYIRTECCNPAWQIVEMTAGNHTIRLDKEEANGGNVFVHLTMSVASTTQVLRVPQYQNVTAQDGGWLTPHPWDGSTGGILAFRAQTQLTVQGAGHIGSSAKGYRGGAVPAFVDGNQGESYFGNGSQAIAENGGGGGGAKTNAADRPGSAGGGGYGTPGTDGTVEADPGQYSGVGGRSYGTADLSTLAFGSGGGSGDDVSGGGSGGDGGIGGGAIFIAAPTFNVAGEIQSVGSNGGQGHSGYHGGGGGSAGGSILLQGNTISIGQPLIAYGGIGAQGINVPTKGGDGGMGRIRVEYCGTFTGQANPPASTHQLQCAPPPAVTKVDPAQGSLTGGTTIALSGTGFVSGASITFGGVAATSVTYTSATAITATAPTHDAGFVDIVVTNADGQSTTLTGAFQYANLAATHLAVALPASTNAGAPINITVTALDASENVATSYTGTIHVTVTDAQAAIPANYTFTTGTGNDNGVHIIPLTLKTAGVTLITVQNKAASGLSASQSVSVRAGPATAFAVGDYPTAVTVGIAGNVTITARDAFGNTASSYVGTVHLSTTDPQAVVPANYTFVTGSGSDNGVHTFAVTFKTAGTQSITAADTTANNVTGAQSGIIVRTPAAVNLAITAPIGATAGNSFSISVTARDASGAAASGYTGTIHFTSSDLQASLPADYSFVAGESGAHMFSATLKTVGTQSITATDTGTGSVSPSQMNISVLPTLTSISPNSGDIKGGTKVTLSGAGFAAGAIVTFDTLPGISVTVVDSATIIVTTPAHAAGAVDVKVTTSGSCRN